MNTGLRVSPSALASPLDPLDQPCPSIPLVSYLRIRVLQFVLESSGKLPLKTIHKLSHLRGQELGWDKAGKDEDVCSFTFQSCESCWSTTRWVAAKITKFTRISANVTIGQRLADIFSCWIGIIMPEAALKLALRDAEV